MERTSLGVLPAQISTLLAATYTIIDPTTGEELAEPGWKLMAMIKAATDALYASTLEAPAPGITPIVSPDADSS